MNRIRRILDDLRPMLSEVSRSLATAHYRKNVAVCSAVFLVTVVACCLPIGSAVPLLDLSALLSQLVSTQLDALNIVHVLDDQTRVLSFQKVDIAIDEAIQIAWPLAIALATLLVWAATAKPSTRHFLGMTVSAIGVVIVSNLLTLLAGGLLSDALSIDMTSGVAGILAIVLCFSLAVVFQVCVIRTVDNAIKVLQFRRALRNTHESDGLPNPVTVRWGDSFVPSGCVVFLLGLSLAGHSLTRETLITNYRLATEQGLNAGDAVAASIASRRLLQIDPDAPAHQFLKAKLLESQGDLDAAETIVREIVDRQGREYAPAHRWLADAITERRTHLVSADSPKDEQSIGRLQQAITADSANIDAHVALAEAYLARNSPRQAVRELEKIVDDRPDLRLTLARLCVLAGEYGNGQLHGQLAYEHYKRELNSFPLSVDVRINYCACLIFLERFPEAVSTLLEGWEQSHNKVFQKAMATCYVVWHDTIIRHGSEKAELLALLNKALKSDPGHAESLKRVAVLATDEERSGPAIDLLTQSLADRPIPAAVHFILGTNAYRHGRVKNALRHLEEAHRLDPENVETMNNLALVLSKSEPPRLERAKALADQAVMRKPNLASIRETRGQILAQLGDWSRAVADLENAMQVMRGHPEIHATLAQAYDHLGDDRLAQQHRKLAEQHAARR